MYVDTNDDGFLSPVDALLVINHLNRSGAEGEGFDLLAAFVGGGSLATSADGVQPSLSSIVEPSILGDSEQEQSRIGARMTDSAFGPDPETSSATDSVFDSADEFDALELLAFNFEEIWKKRR